MTMTEEKKIEMQTKAYLEFREAVDPKVDTMLKQAGEEGLTDACLRRWLRARKWDVSAAARDIEKHAQWALEMKPDGSIPSDKVKVDLQQNKLFLQGISPITSRPLAFAISVRHIPHKPAEAIKSFVAWSLDAAILYGETTAGEEWDGKIDMVFDLTGFGYKNYDLAVLPAIFTTLQDHYVERLGIMYICHAPFIFWGLWKLVSPFIDPVTKQKIKFVTKSDQTEQLGQIHHLLPAEVGGTAELQPIEQVLAKTRKEAATLPGKEAAMGAAEKAALAVLAQNAATLGKEDSEIGGWTSSEAVEQSSLSQTIQVQA